MFNVARCIAKSGNRRFSAASNRWHLEDEGDWFYSSEWWNFNPSSSRTVFREVSHCGNGVVSVVAHPSSQPDKSQWGRTEKWLQQRCREVYPDSRRGEKFKVSGYEWRTLHFNEYTRESTVKVLAAYSEGEPGSMFLMQQPHCLSVPYVKSMVSTGLVTLSASACNLMKNAVEGKEIINILCIGHGGGSLPLFLASKIKGAVVHIVELDPTVISASIETMGFPPFSVMTPSGNRAYPKPDPINDLLWKGTHERLHLFNSDAEKFILNSTDIYDAIFIDAYDGDDIFPHKLWQPNTPFIRSIGNRLHPNHGTVIINLHSDVQPELPTGTHASQVCYSFKNAILGSGTSNGIAYTVSVPWLCNTTLVVGRGFSGNENISFGWSRALSTLMTHSLQVEKLVGMPFCCLQYIKCGFTLDDCT